MTLHFFPWEFEIEQSLSKDREWNKYNQAINKQVLSNKAPRGGVLGYVLT